MPSTSRFHLLDSCSRYLETFLVSTGLNLKVYIREFLLIHCVVKLITKPFTKIGKEKEMTPDLVCLSECDATITSRVVAVVGVSRVGPVVSFE